MKLDFRQLTGQLLVMLLTFWAVKEINSAIIQQCYSPSDLKITNKIRLYTHDWTNASNVTHFLGCKRNKLSNYSTALLSFRPENSLHTLELQCLDLLCSCRECDNFLICTDILWSWSRKNMAADIVQA